MDIKIGSGPITTEDRFSVYDEKIRATIIEMKNWDSNDLLCDKNLYIINAAEK